MNKKELKQLVIECFLSQIHAVGYCQELEKLSHEEQKEINKYFQKIGNKICKALDNSEFYFG